MLYILVTTSDRWREKERERERESKGVIVKGDLKDQCMIS